MRRRLSPFSIAALLGVLALVGLLAYGLVQNEPNRGIEDALARGERAPAPDFTAERLNGGGRASLSDYRGKVVVLNFWASWCEPCRAESPLLDRWQRRLGLDVRDVSDDAREFAREYGLDYPLLRDGPGENMARYGVIGLPETFVIDGRGRIAATKRGPVDEAFMRAKVAPLLRSTSP